MDPKEIEELADMVGMTPNRRGGAEGQPILYWEATPVELQRLVRAVAAKEREACAQTCENQYQRKRPYLIICEAADECAAAIRARGATDGNVKA